MVAHCRMFQDLQRVAKRSQPDSTVMWPCVAVRCRQLPPVAHDCRLGPVGTRCVGFFEINFLNDPKVSKISVESSRSCIFTPNSSSIAITTLITTTESNSGIPPTKQVVSVKSLALPPIYEVSPRSFLNRFSSSIFPLPFDWEPPRKGSVAKYLHGPLTRVNEARVARQRANTL